jgi:hypothetical protein
MINKENEKFWAEKASTMSKPTLEAYAKAIREESQRPGSSEIFPEKVEIRMEIPRDLAEKLQKLKGQNGWEDLMKEFLKLREEKLAAELKEIEQKEIKKLIKKKNLNRNKKILENNRTTISKNDLYKAKSHAPSNKIKKYVLRKTNHTCGFPGCKKPAENLHHTERFAITHQHNPEKIIPLCKAHHELVHDGLVKNEDASPHEWKIRLETDMADLKFLVDQRMEYYRQKALL